MPDKTLVCAECNKEFIFTEGEQAVDIGLTIRIHGDTAAKVMGGRYHGNLVGRDIDSVLQALPVDAGEAVDDEILAAMRNVEQHVIIPGNFQFRVDGLGDDFAGMVPGLSPWVRSQPAMAPSAVSPPPGSNFRKTAA